jgi:carboxymethylenebutenolidase
VRSAMREMGRRLAAEGYAVLVPNPFYRISPAPHFTDFSTFDFSNPADRAKFAPLMASITPPGFAERDAATFVAWLDAQPPVDASKKMGTQGYCMGGALVMRTAAALPNRIGAAASFHGGGLVTDAPTSPHLLIPNIKARTYIAVASNDDAKQPEAKKTLREAFAAAGGTAAIEVYQSRHGWCVADMPAAPDGPIYNREDAEIAWAKLIALYKTALR